MINVWHQSCLQDWLFANLLEYCSRAKASYRSFLSQLCPHQPADNTKSLLAFKLCDSAKQKLFLVKPWQFGVFQHKQPFLSIRGCLSGMRTLTRSNPEKCHTIIIANTRRTRPTVRARELTLVTWPSPPPTLTLPSRDVAQHPPQAASSQANRRSIEASCPGLPEAQPGESPSPWRCSKCTAHRDA